MITVQCDKQLKQVAILSPLVSKLRAVAKNSSKNCQNEQKQVFGLLFLEENSRFARILIPFYEGYGEMGWIKDF